jgi:small subunit ribosomal protein S17
MGIVVGSRMNKTVTVRVDRSFPHPMYRKIVRRSKRVLAHDEANECNVGDRVLVAETRPTSKLKRWRVAEILQRAR